MPEALGADRKEIQAQLSTRAGIASRGRSRARLAHGVARDVRVRVGSALLAFLMVTARPARTARGVDRRRGLVVWRASVHVPAATEVGGCIGFDSALCVLGLGTTGGRRKEHYAARMRVARGSLVASLLSRAIDLPHRGRRRERCHARRPDHDGDSNALRRTGRPRRDQRKARQTPTPQRHERPEPRREPGEPGCDLVMRYRPG